MLNRERLCPPNLPRTPVRKLLIGQRYAFLADALRQLDVEAYFLPDIPEVDARLAGHADLAAVTYDKTVFLGGAAGAQMVPVLRDLGFETQHHEIAGAAYPHDAAFNACVMGKRIFHNRNFSVLQGKSGFVHVRQGYAKCSICPVAPNALITSDAGIVQACMQERINVLHIRPGYIQLPGFGTGFIGGASFLLAPDSLAFVGDFHLHPDAVEIQRFLTVNGVRPICIGKGPLLDIGSAVLLTEAVK